VVQPKAPENLDVEGLLKGIYHFAVPPEVEGDNPPRVQLLASGVGFPWVTEAQRLLAEDWGVAADTWSVTSWNELARDAVAAEEHNLLHPSEDARTPYVTHAQGGRGAVSA
jgi:pyruvate dehydrogenase E1 component